MGDLKLSHLGESLPLELKAYVNYVIHRVLILESISSESSHRFSLYCFMLTYWSQPQTKASGYCEKQVMEDCQVEISANCGLLQKYFNL